MSTLLKEKPEYQAVTVIEVDWDKFSNAPITKELKIARRSTFVAFREGQEVARLVASASKADIEKVFKAALG